MKKRSILILAIVLMSGVILLSVCGLYFTQERRTLLFVKQNHERIEEGLSSGGWIPADDAVLFGYKYVNTWEGSHSMTEFILASHGNTYYGCYYSPDDVPLAFQNTDAELVQEETDRWIWKSEGDNHGTTTRIMEKWYSFEASF